MNKMSKLTASKVIMIVDMYHQGLSQSQIAGMFGVSRRAISHIVTKKTWSYLWG